MKKAFLVGINYIGTQCQLAGCINDIDKIQSLLLNKYQFDSITTLTDSTVLKPTKQNIMQGLENLVANTTPEDTIVFYYSGHGTQVRDQDGDEVDGTDEALYTLDNYVITDDELHTTFTKSNAITYVFLDCCHSGTLCDLKYNIKPTSKTSFMLWEEQNKQTDKNICVFSGCLDLQTSADASFVKQNNEYESNGAFTYMLLAILEKSSMSANKDILHELVELLRQARFDQIPQISCSHLMFLERTFLH